MLKSLPLFSLLSQEELSALAPCVQRRSYLAHTLILRAGEKSDGLYLILSGQAQAVIEDGDAHEFVVARLGPNEFFGEMGLIEDSPGSVTVESQTRCEVLCVPRRRFLQCLEQNAAAAVWMLRATLARLQETHRKIEGLALMTVDGRVSRVLLELGREERGEWLVDMGTEQIAAMVGASREMVSRVLKDMTTRGTLRRHKRRLIVLDRASVEQRTHLNGHHVSSPEVLDCQPA